MLCVFEVVTILTIFKNFRSPEFHQWLVPSHSALRLLLSQEAINRPVGRLLKRGGRILIEGAIIIHDWYILPAQRNFFD